MRKKKDLEKSYKRNKRGLEKNLTMTRKENLQRKRVNSESNFKLIKKESLRRMQLN
jgi:hypothetical protein